MCGECILSSVPLTPPLDHHPLLAPLRLHAGSECFVIDLLALAARGGAAERALTDALQPALASDQLYKLGCGIAADLKKLTACRPVAFALARSCLDLSALWRSLCIEQSELISGGAQLFPLLLLHRPGICPFQQSMLRRLRAPLLILHLPPPPLQTHHLPTCARSRQALDGGVQEARRGGVDECAGARGAWQAS